MCWCCTVRGNILPVMKQYQLIHFCMGRDIIYKGGSVVDAGIAAALCEGSSMSQSMGLGGGFFATIYIKETGQVYTLNARETAPKAATADMYFGNPEASQTGGY